MRVLTLQDLVLKCTLFPRPSCSTYRRCAACFSFPAYPVQRPHCPLLALPSASSKAGFPAIHSGYQHTSGEIYFWLFLLQ